MKKLNGMLSLLLIAAILLAALTACENAKSDEDEEPSDQTAAVTNEYCPCGQPIVDFSHLFEDLPEELRTIVIAFAEETSTSFLEHTLVVDETQMDMTDAVNLAVQKRNQFVEEYLSVTIQTENVGSNLSDFESSVSSAILSNSGKWDILAGDQYYSVGMAKKGLLHNLADLDAVGPDAIKADYITLENSYWATEYNDAMSYNGAYYWITGDLALRYLDGMYGTFVNADIYSAKIQETYGSIYDIVKQGKWTLDLMAEMAQFCYVDDGDDIRNEADTFGIGYEMNDVMDALAIGSNVQFSTKDQDTGAVSITLDNSRTYEFAEKLYDTVTGDAMYSYNYGNNDSSNVMQAFAKRKVVFTVNKLQQVPVYLHNSDNYYFIPLPKMDEEQMNYATAVDDRVTVFGIPVDCMKLPQTAATLELLALYSEEYVKTAYYDSLLKGSYTGDHEVAEMIDLIYNSATTDFAAAWGYSLGDPVQVFRKQTYIDSFDKLKIKAWQQSLNELCKALDSVSTRTEEK